MPFVKTPSKGKTASKTPKKNVALKDTKEAAAPAVEEAEDVHERGSCKSC